MVDIISRGKNVRDAMKQYLKKYMKKESGYTLIEVIIVAAIIGILLTIGTAHYIEAQRIAIEHLCATRLANIAAFEKMYFREYAQYATFEELQTQGFIDKAYDSFDDVTSRSTPYVPEYWLEFNITTDTYQIIARPILEDFDALYVRWRTAGGQEDVRSMFVDQDGVVRFLRNKRPIF